MAWRNGSTRSRSPHINAIGADFKNALNKDLSDKPELTVPKAFAGPDVGKVASLAAEYDSVESFDLIRPLGKAPQSGKLTKASGPAQPASKPAQPATAPAGPASALPAPKLRRRQLQDVILYDLNDRGFNIAPNLNI